MEVKNAQSFGVRVGGVGGVGRGCWDTHDKSAGGKMLEMLGHP